MTLVLFHHTGPLPWRWSSSITLVLFHHTGPLPWHWSSSITLVLFHHTGPLPWRWSSSITLVLFHDTGPQPRLVGCCTDHGRQHHRAWEVRSARHTVRLHGCSHGRQTGARHATHHWDRLSLQGSHGPWTESIVRGTDFPRSLNRRRNRGIAYLKRNSRFSAKTLLITSKKHTLFLRHFENRNSRYLTTLIFVSVTPN